MSEEVMVNNGVDITTNLIGCSIGGGFNQVTVRMDCPGAVASSALDAEFHGPLLNSGCCKIMGQHYLSEAIQSDSKLNFKARLNCRGLKTREETRKAGSGDPHGMRRRCRAAEGVWISRAKNQKLPKRC